jgi:hypothetical protein
MGLEINQKLLPLKAHYFLYNAATAPVVPFIPTMARQLGFSTGKSSRFAIHILYLIV